MTLGSTKSFILGLFAGAGIVAGVLGHIELALFFVVAFLATELFVEEELVEIEDDEEDPVLAGTLDELHSRRY